MRTTIILPDPIYERAKHIAREKGSSLSTFISEAIETFISRESVNKSSGKSKYRLKTFDMGNPAIDISNREEIYKIFED